MRSHPGGRHSWSMGGRQNARDKKLRPQAYELAAVFDLEGNLTERL